MQCEGRTTWNKSNTNATGVAWKLSGRWVSWPASTSAEINIRKLQISKKKSSKPFLMISLFETFKLEARFDDLKTKSHSEAEITSKAPSSSILHFISPNEIWNIIFRLPHSFQSDSTNPKSTFELVIQRKGFNLIISCLSFQSSVVFDLLKAHLKRAPSLRGAALVRLASLKFQAEPWPPLIYNKTEALARLDEVR